MVTLTGSRRDASKFSARRQTVKLQEQQLYLMLR